MHNEDSCVGRHYPADVTCIQAHKPICAEEEYQVDVYIRESDGALCGGHSYIEPSSTLATI